MHYRNGIIVCVGVCISLVIALATWLTYETAQAPTAINTPTNNTATEHNESAATTEAYPLLSTQGWPTIFVNIVSHNEDSISPSIPDYRTTEDRFQREREGTLHFATMLKEHNVRYNWQSDWDFLLAVESFDDGSDTNGKNIVQYLAEDLNVSIDPHSHEKAGYNYADVAYRMSRLGVTPSGVVGGLIAEPPEDSKLEYLWELKRGKTFPTYQWSPQVLWGGGTSLHIDEEALWISGIWRPQDNEHYDTHDNKAPLATVGHYKSSWDGLDALLALQTAGALKPGAIYTVSIMNRQGDFTDEYIEDFSERLETCLDETADGRLTWTTIQGTYEAWQSRYNETPTRLHWTE